MFEQYLQRLFSSEVLWCLGQSGFLSDLDVCEAMCLLFRDQVFFFFFFFTFKAWVPQ